MVVAKKKSVKQFVFALFWTILGAFLASYSLEVFLIPNDIIDGGIIGVSILIAELLGKDYLLYPLLVFLSIPFVFLAYKNISKTFVIQMIISVIAFSLIGFFIHYCQGYLQDIPNFLRPYLKGPSGIFEAVVIGGVLLGLGVGLIIRSGGCLDGTEILGILINKKYGFTVGSVVLVANIIIFTFAGFILEDVQSSIRSLITFFIVVKIMDMVIVGFDEMKALTILSSKPQQVSDLLLREMGIGLTVLQGRGGYTGKPQEVLYLIAERLQLAEIKSMVHDCDPKAVIAIENLHEVSTGKMDSLTSKV